MLLGRVSLELRLTHKHNKPILAAVLKQARVVPRFKVVFELLIAGKVFVAVGGFPAAEVAVVVLLLHVLVDLLAVVKVHFAKPACQMKLFSESVSHED
jgi:hypothetical protein